MRRRGLTVFRPIRHDHHGPLQRPQERDDICGLLLGSTHHSTGPREAHLKRYILLLAAALLVACGSSDSDVAAGSAAVADPIQSPAPAPGPTAETVGDTVESRADLFIALDGEGLRLVTRTGSTRLLPFGAPAQEIETALERIWGPARQRIELPDCGYEPPVMIGWDQGLNLLTVDGVFVGWSAMGDGEAGGPSTMAGLAVGVERAVAEAAYEIEVAETTVGIEFETAGIFGVFEDGSADARVRSLWAGRACIYR